MPSTYLIHHRCPQCGAPATLFETDRLVRCDYCRVKSYLHPKDVFRYLLPHNAPADRELFYVPYWRFKGMLFSCLPSGIGNRFVDTSQKAISSALIPPSLGLRSQTMKLSFVGPQHKGWFIRPQISSAQAMTKVVQRQSRHSSAQTFHQALIGETLSLIYAPFYTDGKMMDAILNEPVSPRPVDNFERESFKGGPASSSIHFMATICPHCGWDLRGDRDTLVLHCTHCSSMWRSSKKALKRISVAHMPARESEPSLFLPFWRIQADVSGIELRSYSDLVRQANLPKTILPDWNRTPMFFWGPAFKVSPRSFLRLTHQVTLSQPWENLSQDMPDGPLHPVTLPLTESIETMQLNLAGIIRPKRRIQSCLNDLRIEPKRALLTYLPFSIRHHDLVQPRFNIAVNRNQLALADNL